MLNQKCNNIQCFHAEKSSTSRICIRISSILIRMWQTFATQKQNIFGYGSRETKTDFGGALVIANNITVANSEHAIHM